MKKGTDQEGSKTPILQPNSDNSQPIAKPIVSRRYSFAEKEPNVGDYISLVWEDGSDCECAYNGLDRSILPLPAHWYYVAENGG